MMTTLRIVLASLSAVSLGAMLFGGCAPFEQLREPPVYEGAELRRFASEQEFLEFFQYNAADQSSRGLLLFDSDALAGAVPAGADEAAGDDGGGDQANSFSTTNIQEAGVDESDVFKSDGTYFYIGREEGVHIVQASPMGQLGELASVDVGADIDSLYLYQGSLIVLAREYGGGPAYDDRAAIDIWPPYQIDSRIVIVQIDVSTPETPTVVGQTELEGALVTSRLTGGQLTVISTMTPDVPSPATLSRVRGMEVDEIMPRARFQQRSQERLALSWENCYRPARGDGYVTTVISVLDAADVESLLGTVGVMAEAGTIYASTEALYITDDEWDWESDYRHYTTVHKFAFRDGDAPGYVGTATVPGRLLNQFSLGESDGYLRVATHVDSFGGFFGDGGVGVAVANAPGGSDGGPASSDGGDADDNADADEDEQVAQVIGDADPPYNALYVIGEGVDGLEIVGEIEGIAPGEDLYAARFVGARGFLVTFEQIDPLWVLDLTDPTSPAILGELEIPGYSDYLHPYGEDLLIGIGRSTTAAGWGGAVPDAVQLSLFDVSDMTSPQVIEQIEVGGFGSVSDVSYTHKAFTFMADSGLLALPVTLQDDNIDLWEYGPPAFDGVLCYDVDATGFTERGRLAAVTSGDDEWWYDRWNSWRRAAFIGDTLYALSPAGVQAAPLSDLSSTSVVELTDAVE